MGLVISMTRIVDARRNRLRRNLDAHARTIALFGNFDGALLGASTSAYSKLFRFSDVCACSGISVTTGPSSKDATLSAHHSTRKVTPAEFGVVLSARSIIASLEPCHSSSRPGSSPRLQLS
jgi:hypothetical protein